MTLIHEFFRELDAGWGTPPPAKVCLRVIGSSALMLQTDYARGTKDSDVLETNDLTDNVKSRLLAAGGMGSRLHTKYAMYLELVSSVRSTRS